MIALLIETGLRFGECEGLTWDTILQTKDFVKHYIELLRMQMNGRVQGLWKKKENQYF